MGGLFDDPQEKARKDAARLQAEMKETEAAAVKSAARLAGLSAAKVTQTRARSVGGGLASGGQAQRTGGIQGGKIGGPLGKRGPAGSSGPLLRRSGTAGA